MNRKLKVRLSVAASALVEAFRKVGAANLAKLCCDVRVGQGCPTTFAELYREVRDEGLLRVDYSNSDTSVYGRDGNVAFRVMHDTGHVLELLGFTFHDEVRLAIEQWRSIVPLIKPELLADCHSVYMADTLEQSRYEQSFGHFPWDQTAFVVEVLRSKHGW